MADPEVKVEARYDAATESRRLLIIRTHHGTPHYTVDRRRLPRAAATMRRSGPPPRCCRGWSPRAPWFGAARKQRVVRSFRDALDWLLAEARASVVDPALQGAGRDESRAIVGDDDGPEGRRLLRVQIEDAIASDEIFDRLMGEEVEPRRAFIESNALGVRNLDV